MSWWEFPDFPEDRQRSRHRVEGEERFEGVEVEVAFGKRVELGGERQLAAHVAVVQRLDPEAVAGEHEAPVASVPDCDREHAAEPLGKSEPPLLVGVDDRLGVAVRPETMAGSLELALQFS